MPIDSQLKSHVIYKEFETGIPQDSQRESCRISPSILADYRGYLGNLGRSHDYLTIHTVEFTGILGNLGRSRDYLTIHTVEFTGIFGNLGRSRDYLTIHTVEFTGIFGNLGRSRKYLVQSTSTG